MKKSAPYNINGLYVITPDSYEVMQLCQQVKQAILGGARLVQYRNKYADESLRMMQATALLALCRSMRIPLIINDHLDLMMRIGADGLHLGQNDLQLSAARRLIGAKKILGASCYNRLELAIEAEKAGANYVTFGACYIENNESTAPHASLALFREAKQAVTIPIVGIGGLQLDNALPIVQAGANGLAVSSDIFLDDDIQGISSQYADLFTQPLIHATNTH